MDEESRAIVSKKLKTEEQYVGLNPEIELTAFVKAAHCPFRRGTGHPNE
jgi:hypothetical protein